MRLHLEQLSLMWSLTNKTSPQPKNRPEILKFGFPPKSCSRLKITAHPPNLTLTLNLKNKLNEREESINKAAFSLVFALFKLGGIRRHSTTLESREKSLKQIKLRRQQKKEEEATVPESRSVSSFQLVNRSGGRQG
jgi:hypothetical protein